MKGKTASDETEKYTTFLTEIADMLNTVEKPAMIQEQKNQDETSTDIEEGLGKTF